MATITNTYKYTIPRVLSNEDLEYYINEIARTLSIPKSYLDPLPVSCSIASMSEEDFEEARISYYGA